MPFIHMRLKYSFLLISLSIIVLYGNTITLFFYYDDFERLRDVIENQGNPLFIFEPIYRPGVAYFTPIFYLFFGTCYKLFGLNPVPFHLMTLITHSVNSCLVCYFAFLLSRQASLATMVGIVFAINFSITDALIWPAAYADPIMFLFAILTLIGFYRYIESNRRPYYILSVLCFILALASKITAMFIPLALLSMEVYYYIVAKQKGFKVSMLTKYLPFIICNLIYLLIIKVFVPQLQVASIIDYSQFFMNLFMIPLLYVIPEGLLPNSIIYPLFIDIIILSILIFFSRYTVKKEMLWFGLLLLLVGILALVPAKWNFPLYPEPFNESLRHRLYLGNLGYAIFIGTIIHEIYIITSNKFAGRFLFVCGLFIFLMLNLTHLARIKSDFIKVTSDTERAIKQIRAQVLRLPEDKRTAYIVNFPPKQGFGRSLHKLFLIDIDGFRFGSWPSKIPTDVPPDSIQIYLQQDGNVYDKDSNVGDVARTAWDHFYAGQFLLLTGKAIEAEAEFHKASAKALWGDWKIYYYLGISHSKAGRKDMAIEELNKAILNNRQNADVYSLLGTMYLEKGEESKGVNNLELALRYNAADFKRMEDLAILYKARGETKKARDLFKKALSLDHRPEYRRWIEKNLQEQ